MMRKKGEKKNTINMHFNKSMKVKKNINYFILIYTFKVINSRLIAKCVIYIYIYNEIILGVGYTGASLFSHFSLHYLSSPHDGVCSCIPGGQ